MKLLKKLKKNKNLIASLFLLIALPVIIALIFVRQDIRQRAADNQTITKVVIVPGIDTTVNGSPVYLSAQVYDQNNQPIMDGVTYDWGISSPTNTIGTLVSVSGSIATFVPKNVGTGHVYVNASNINGSQTGSILARVGNATTPTLTPTRTPTPTLSPTPSVFPTPTTNPITTEVRGNHVNWNNTPFASPAQKVTLIGDNGHVFSSTAGSTPWSITNVPVGIYRIMATHLPGYIIEYQICTGCTTFQSSNYRTGSVISTGFPANNFTNISFRYTPLPTHTIFRTGDVNSDNLVNVTDLSMLLSNWNSIHFLNADFNKNGVVNLTDLSILLSNWNG